MITWSAHLSMLFVEHPWLQRPAAARQAGFAAVESWWPSSGLDLEWAAELARHRLQVSSINSHEGSIEAGERGFLNVPSLHDNVLASFQKAVELAQRVGAKRINVLVGRARRGASRASQLKTAAAALREFAALAEAANLVILIEPLNEHDIPGYLVPTAAEAVRLIDEVGSSSIALLYDAYHAARSGANPVNEVKSFVGFIGHVQYADAPGRGAPGTGGVDIWAFVQSLVQNGYEGTLGLEYQPGRSTVESLRFLENAPPEAPFPTNAF